MTAKRVFIVDDEKCIADLLAIILGSAGHETHVFYNAESALAQIALGPPDLVISDVFMPGLNGVDMAVLVKERHPECKILLISGNAAMTGVLDKARMQGHNFECLSKPVPISVLLAKIESTS